MCIKGNCINKLFLNLVIYNKVKTSSVDRIITFIYLDQSFISVLVNTACNVYIMIRNSALKYRGFKIFSKIFIWGSSR